MNIYHFAVCDDRPEDARLVASLAAQWARRTGAEVELEVFPSAEAFLFRYQEKKDFDILLLDIEMTGMDGVELAKTVRQDSEAVQIVFITGYSDYIAQGYEVSALHYLMKRREAAEDRRALPLHQGGGPRLRPGADGRHRGAAGGLPLPEQRGRGVYYGNPAAGGVTLQFVPWK